MSTEPPFVSPRAGLIACAALAFVFCAPCAISQSPPAQAQSQDARTNAGQCRIEAIVIRGARRVAASTIKKSIANHVGDIYDPAKVARDVAALKATEFFDDVRVETADSPGGGKTARQFAFETRSR